MAKKSIMVHGRSFTFRPGYIVQPEFTSTGGVQYHRDGYKTNQTGPGLEVEYKTLKKVDNVELDKMSKSIIQLAYRTLGKHTTNTPVGIFADEETLPAVEQAMDEVRREANLFNKMAAALGSERCVTVEIYAVEVSFENEKIAQRLIRTVRERVAALYADLRNCDREAFEADLRDCKGLERLATGIQADSIRMALHRAKYAKTEMLERLRLGMDATTVGPMLDLEALEQCITLFTPEEALVEHEDAA